MAKILIIEDDPYVQRMYKRLFALKNYELLIASNGEQGVLLAHEGHPDVILLDIMMQGMNGLEVLEKLKNESDTQHIPVLMLTNLSDDLTIEKAKSLGADSYMVKADFLPQQVLDEVEKRLPH